jgi:hypothetical protein
VVLLTSPASLPFPTNSCLSPVTSSQPQTYLILSLGSRLSSALMGTLSSLICLALSSTLPPPQYPSSVALRRQSPTYGICLSLSRLLPRLLPWPLPYLALLPFSLFSLCLQLALLPTGIVPSALPLSLPSSKP